MTFEEGKDPIDKFYNYLDNEKYYKTHGKYADDVIDMELVSDAPPEAVEAFENYKKRIKHLREMGVDC